MSHGDAGLLDRPSLACPLCATRDPGQYVVAATVGRGNGHPGAARSYRVFRCRPHGVEFADAGENVGDPFVGAATKDVLDEFYGALDDDRDPRSVLFMDRVERVAGPAGRLHDVGCGNGQLLLEARRRGWAVQGNDLLDAVAPALAARRIAYFTGPLSTIPLEPGSRDVVTSFCVLPHHLADPLPDLLAVARLLRPGGWFVAEMPIAGLYRRLAWLSYRLSGGRLQMPLANIYQPRGHVFGYTTATIRALLERCGFEWVTAEPYAQPASLSTARFAGRARPFRIAARLGVGSLAVAARLLGLPNHVVVVARVPGLDAR